MSARLRAAIYARLSKDLRDGVNVEHQVRDGYAVTDGLGIDRADVRVFIDNDKGASRQASKRGVVRDDWGALIDAVKNHELDILVAYNLDRMTRQMAEWEVLIQAAESGKLVIRQLSGGEIDLTDSDARMNSRVKIAFAQGETDRMAERIQRTHDRYRNGGDWQPTSRRPFGYASRVDGEIFPAGMRIGDVVPGEAELIRTAAQMVIDGVAPVAIAKWFNDAGVVTSRGGQWNSATVTKMLIAPRIAGWTAQRRKGTNAWVYVAEGTWEPIISRETQEMVLAVIHGRSTGRPGRRSAMTAMVRCAHCDRVMNRTMASNGQPRYVCTRRFDIGEGCGNAITARAVDPQVNDFALRALALVDAQERATHQVATPVEDLDALQHEIDLLWSRYNSEAIDWRQWDERNTVLKERQRVAQAALGERVERGQVRRLAGDLATLGERWDDPDFDADIKRGLLQLVVDHVSCSKATTRYSGGQIDYDRIEIIPTTHMLTLS